MSSVFHRHTAISPPRAVAGEGCYIVDENGKHYLDASGGAAVSCLGHGDPDVTAAIKQQLDAIAFAHTGFFSSEPAEELATLLAENAPGDLNRVYFVSGGSEGVEAALKLARQYAVEKGQPEREHFIARWQSYHGNTLGGLSVGGNKARRGMFAPMLLPTHHIDPCFAYRHRLGEESEEEYGLRAAEQLRSKILELGPDTVVAFIAETVVGATAGAVPPAPGYFRRIRDICDEFGVLLILDEVMCGMGRCGSLFTCEQEGVTPDIVVIAKGLGAGYQPIGAAISSEEIYRTIAEGSGFFQHGHTYIGHPTACAAALAVQRKLVDQDLVSRAAEMGDRLDAVLHDAFGNHPHVGDIRGRGLFRAIEFVADRSSKAPFDPELALHARIKRAALDRGLICYPMGGTIDGRRGDHVLLAPPFIVDDAALGELTDKLSAAVAAALGGVLD
jgi:adenosylmethionine-8-amino-7-oxononanoate aminotransferase